HARNSIAYRHTTVAEHMPKSHQAHLEWTPSRLIHWAEGIGAATAQVVRTILERKPHPEMGYRACLGILRLEKIYSRARLEAASQRAVQLQTFSYQSLKSILKNSLDRQLLLDQQWLWKENRALARRLRAAHLKERGIIEDVDYQHPRGLDRKLMRTLASSEWVRQHQNLLLIGPTGIGKSWLACALAHKACRDGCSVLHKRTSELFRELAGAHADGSI